MFAGGHPPGPRRESAPPRSLDKLLKEVEKGTQVRRTGLDAVLDELKQHRDARRMPSCALRSSAVCRADAVPGKPDRGAVPAADGGGRRRQAGARRCGPAASKRRFWT